MGANLNDPSPAAAAGCELCRAARITPWFHEDAICWIAECEICTVPMVVWKRHGPHPPPDEEAHMLDQLTRVATELFGDGGFFLDPVMRQIPDHFHAHARDRDWWARRMPYR